MGRGHQSRTFFFFGATSYDNVTTAATEVSETAQQNKGGGTETALRVTMTDDGRRGGEL